jgi:DNA-binding beta-propeller fold protein YncE
MASRNRHGYGREMTTPVDRAVTVLLVGALLGLGSTTVPAETLLVVRKSAGVVDFVDPGSGLTLSSVVVGFAPHEISRSPDGRFAAVSNYGTRDRAGTTLSILDLEHPRELRRIELGEYRRPHGIVWYAEDRIAVTTEEPAALLVVDPRAARVITQVPTKQAGSHMVAVISELRAFVTNRVAGSTTVIDLASGRKLADVPTGAGSEAIAVTRDGREVWVAAREAGTITVLHSQTNGVLATLTVPGEPIRIVMTPHGTALVSCAGSGEVVAFDARNRRETGRVMINVQLPARAGARAGTASATGAVPVGISIAGDDTVFVAATRADKVVALALPALTVTRTIDVPGEPDGMAFTPIMPQAVCHACEAPADPYAPGEAD